jgi:hypothetical protein
MSTDCRAELQRLVEAIKNWDFDTGSLEQDWSALDRAEAALAQPEPVAPKDEEIEEAAKLIYASMRLAVPGKYHTTDWVKRGNSLMQDEARRTARAVYDFARYGTPAIQPVPVSERPWEREGWCDAEGQCWMGDPGGAGFIPSWRLCRPGDARSMTYSLPHHALPTPEASR